MSITTITPGSVGADYYTTTPQILQWLRDNKAQFVVRYISIGNSQKNVTPAEIKVLHDAGYALNLVFEGATSDVAGGALAGARNGAFAAAKAVELGYPSGLPIVAAADTDVVTSNLGAAVDYMTAFKKAVEAGGYRLGMYADEDLGKVVPCDQLTIPCAQYWSKQLFARIRAKLPWGLTVHCIQSCPPKTGVQVDKLTVYTSFQAWAPTVAQPAPAPAPAWAPTADPSTWLVKVAATPVTPDPHVASAQRALNTHGGKLTADGWFGQRTEDAVRAFQAASHLLVDGKVGPKTWSALGA